MAVALPVRITEGSTSISSTVSCGDAVLVQASDVISSILIILSVSDVCVAGLTESSPLVVQAISTTDTVRALATEGTPAVINPNTASFSVTESIPLSVTDVVQPAVVSSSVSDTGPFVSDIVSNLSVFTGNSTQTISVSDSIVVRVNGRDIVTPPVSISVVDSLAVTAGDTVNAMPVISILSADTVLMGVVDIGRTPVIAVSVPESVSIGIVEPNDQNSAFGVLDTVAAITSEASPVVAGGFVFTVSESVAVAITESTPSFGQVSVGAIETAVVQIGDIPTISKSISVPDAVTIQASEVLSSFNAISVTDGFTINTVEVGNPVFNNFVTLATSESVGVSVSETISQLTSFLAQIQTSDSCSVSCVESFLANTSTVSSNDLASIILTTQFDAQASVFSADSLAVGLVESGLAIPIVTVNATTFTSDTIFGCTDNISRLFSDQSILDGIAFTLADVATVSVFIAVTDSASLKVNDRNSIASAVSASDSQSIQLSDIVNMKAAYSVSDSCAVAAGDHTSGYVAVANTSSDTWNGTTLGEHWRYKPKPWNYVIKDKHNW